MGISRWSIDTLQLSPALRATTVHYTQERKFAVEEERRILKYWNANVCLDILFLYFLPPSPFSFPLSFFPFRGSFTFLSILYPCFFLSLPFLIFFSRVFSDSILRRLAVFQLQCAFRARLNCRRATIWTIILKILPYSRWNALLYECSSLSQNL